MKRRPDYKKGSSTLSVMMTALTVALYFFIFTWLFIFLIVFGGRLPRWLYFTLLFLYLAFLFGIGMYLYRRIDFRRERAVYGDDAFFEAHPKEWKRELRRWRKSGAYHVVSEDLPAVLRGEEGTPLKQGTPYDELYYRMYPKALRRDLKRQQFKRRLRGIFTSSPEPSVYERRLSELAEKIEVE